jgi:hypothetical protein
LFHSVLGLLGAENLESLVVQLVVPPTQPDKPCINLFHPFFERRFGLVEFVFDRVQAIVRYES